MKKVLIVFGTRPEAIKMARLVHYLKEFADEFSVNVCVTAQHREMLDQVLAIFEIKPEIDLNLMTPGQNLSSITSSILVGLDKVIRESKPDLVLVHGDTTTSFAAALASFYSNVPVGHIEAGLRTYDLFSPFPEEFNRQTVSKVVRWHFAPTFEAKQNLLSEGISDSQILVTGNTVIDSLLWMIENIEKNSFLNEKIHRDLQETLKFSVKSIKFVLVTGHRRENFGKGILEICGALEDLALKYPEVQFVYPVHLNPNVLGPVSKIIGGLPNISLIPPQDYEHFVVLLKHCYLVLTDSGGIQEEAPSLGKPVLVMRESTERPEAVQAGTVKLVGANRGEIFKNVSQLLESSKSYDQMSKANNPYGDGQAARYIVDFLRTIQ